MAGSGARERERTHKITRAIKNWLRSQKYPDDQKNRPRDVRACQQAQK